MASATRKTVEKTITEDVTVLELTKEEAKSLLAMINGYGENSRHWAIRDALLESPFTEERPIEVGDKVRIIEANSSPAYNGRIGMVGRIDPPDDSAPYRVQFSDGDYEWAVTVERVND